MLRQAQHERKISNDFSHRSVRPEPVEGRRPVFSLHFKKETYISLKLPEALVARLEAEARSRQKSKSAIIRDYLEQGLNGTQRGK